MLSFTDFFNPRISILYRRVPHCFLLYNPTMNFDQAEAAILNLIANAAGDSDLFAERLRSEQFPHLSFSQVITVEACPYRYYLQYVRGEPLDPVPDYFTKGRILHQLIARDYAHGRCASSASACEEDVVRHFSGENCTHLLNAFRLHIRNAWRECEVVAVEHPFVMRLDPALPPVVGVIDLILRSQNGYLLVDHKTGRNFYPDDELQVAIYAQYIRAVYGEQDCRLYYDHYRWVNNLARIRKPAFQRVEARADPRSWPRHRGRIHAAYLTIKAIRAGAPAARIGACYRCPYRPICLHY